MPALLEKPRRKRPIPTVIRPASIIEAEPGPAVERDHLLVMDDASWGLYLDLDSKFQDTSTRVSYSNRRIDIMTLSTDHERIKGNLHDFIVAHCQDEGIEYSSQGSATLRIDFKQGKEPDDSFIFGTETKARPDLVVEIVLTSGCIDKLEFYAPLQIPEVWVWEGAGLVAYALDGSRYRRVKKSRLLPKFDLVLAGDLATATRTSQAVREFRKRGR